MFDELRAGRRRRRLLLDSQPHAHVVIEAGQHIFEALHPVLDGEVLLLRLLAVLHLERQLALLQLEILDGDDCESRKPEHHQDADDQGHRRDQVRDHVRRHESYTEQTRRDFAGLGPIRETSRHEQTSGPQRHRLGQLLADQLPELAEQLHPRPGVTPALRRIVPSKVPGLHVRRHPDLLRRRVPEQNVATLRRSDIAARAIER